VIKFTWRMFRRQGSSCGWPALSIVLSMRAAEP